MKMTPTRRQLLAAIGATGAASALVAGQDGDGGGEGGLWGASMALDEPFLFAEGPDGKVWIGPASARFDKPAEDGNVYWATEGVDYYGDSGTWKDRTIGSPENPVPSVTTDEIGNKSPIYAKPGDDLQAKADAAAGGKLVFVAGTFDADQLDGGSLNLPSDTTVEGQGEGTQFNTTTNAQVFKAEGKSGITIRDLRAVGNESGGAQMGVDLIDCTDCTVENVTVEDMGYDGISLFSTSVGNSKGHTVDDCTVINCQDDGINLNYTTHSDITNCDVRGVANDGIHIWNHCEYTDVIGCDLEDCNIRVYFNQDQISIDDCHVVNGYIRVDTNPVRNVTISNSTVEGTSNFGGIWLDGVNNGVVRDITVDSCHLIDCYRGVDLQGVTDVTVEATKVRGSTGSGQGGFHARSGAKRVTLDNCSGWENADYAVIVDTNVEDFTADNFDGFNNQQDGAGGTSAVYCDATGVTFKECNFGDTQGTPTQSSGILFDSDATDISILHCDLRDPNGGLENPSNITNPTIHDNKGYVTENGGETTVDDGGTIAHGLDETPVVYNVEALDAGQIAIVTGVDGTNLTVEVLTVSDGSTGGTGNNVSWSAKAASAVGSGV